MLVLIITKVHSNAEGRYHTFFWCFTMGEPMVREDIAIRALHAVGTGCDALDEPVLGVGAISRL